MKRKRASGLLPMVAIFHHLSANPRKPVILLLSLRARPLSPREAPADHGMAAPHKLLLNVFIVVPIDSAGGGYFAPGNMSLALLCFRREPARSFRDNFEAAGGVKMQLAVAKGVVGHAFHEALSKVNVIRNVKESDLVRVLRRHRSGAAPPQAELKVSERRG